MITRALLLVPVVLVLSCGPGLFFVRRLRWSPLEKLTGAIGCSLLLLGSWTFLLYVTGLPTWSLYLATAASCAATAVSIRDAPALLRSSRLRRTVAAFGLLLVWTLGAQALIRHYSGGDWCCDWVEHYQRTLFFLERWPRDFRFIGVYPLTTRPPLMNLVAAYFLGHLGNEFALYQIVFSILNLFAFFPCCLFAQRFAPRVRQTPYLVAIALAFNPMFFMNTTFAWTKVLTAFYVLLAVWLYLAGAAKRDTVRLSAAFLFMTAGLLVHYSALPFAMFLALAYAVTIWPGQPDRFRHLMLVALPGALLGLAWMAWSIGAYGLTTTFAANATVAGTAQSDWVGNIVRISLNAFHTFWPYLYPGHPDDTPLRLLTDRAFTFYQENFLGAMGSVSAYVVIATLAGVFWLGRSRMRVAELRFWAWFIPFTILVGIAIDGETTLSGFANICLQPVVYLAVTLVAARMVAFPRPVRLLVAIGLVLDMMLGVALELYMESQMEPWARTPNWDWKQREQLVYLGDVLRDWALPIWACLGVGAMAAAWYLARVALGATDANGRWPAGRPRVPTGL